METHAVAISVKATVAAVRERVLAESNAETASHTVSLADIARDVLANDAHPSFELTGHMQAEAISGCMGEHPECPCNDCDDFRHK